MIKACILLVVALAVVARAHGTPRPVTWTVTALGVNQVPKPITTSKLTSTLKFTVDKQCNIKGTASVGHVKDFTEAHFHIGTAAMNGLVTLIIWNPQTVTQPLTGSFTWAFSQNATDLMNTEAKATCAQFLSNLMNGHLYYNVHTLANPKGEARGQVHMA